MSHLYTWSELRQKIRDVLGDQTGKIWTNAELQSYADSTLDELSLGSEAHIKKYRLMLESGLEIYTLPTDCHEVRSVKVNGIKVWGRENSDITEFDPSSVTGADTLGTPYAYQIWDLQTIIFYPTPSWTDDWDDATFSAEYGITAEVVEDSTAWTEGYATNTGEIQHLIDTSNGHQYQVAPDDGIIVGYNSTVLVAEIEYVYQPARITLDTQYPDLPAFMSYPLMHGILEKAFVREGQGQNAALSSFFGSMFEQESEQWFGRMREMDRSADQMISQRPVNYSSDLDWRFRGRR